MTQVLKVVRVKRGPSLLMFLHNILRKTNIDVDNPSFVEHFPGETIGFQWFSTSFCMFPLGSPRGPRCPAEEMGDTQLKTKEERLAQERLADGLDVTMIVVLYAFVDCILYPLVNIQKTIENGHRNGGFTHLNMVIFHSYVSLPEGTYYYYIKIY
jgi:hypothetical protein